MKNFLRNMDEKIFVGFIVLLIPAIFIFIGYLLIQAAIIDLMRLIILGIGILICWTIGHFVVEHDDKLKKEETK